MTRAGYMPRARTDSAFSYATSAYKEATQIDYKYGLYVRSSPGGPIIASALNETTWRYRQSSVFVDKQWKIWVEVKLIPPVKGYTTGWILVKDQLGTYFTDPPIDFD